MPFKEIGITPQVLVLEVYHAIKDHGFIGGGCVRSLHQNSAITDIDIFCFAEKNYSIIRDSIVKLGFEEIYSNPMLTKFRRIDVDDELDNNVTKFIEVISPRQERRLLTFGQPEQVISNFDFTICRAALLNATTALVDDCFESDVEDKRLRIRNIVCPLTTTKRIAKYGSYGYKIGVSEAIKLFSHWDSMSFEDRTDLVKMLKAVENHEELTAEQEQIMKAIVYVD